MAEKIKNYIKVQGELVEVSEEVYLTYYRMERKARVVVEKDQRNGTVLFSDLDTKGLLATEMFQDQDAISVEDTAVGSVMKEKLHQCLQILPQQERDMIYAIYFEGLSERQFGYRMERGLVCINQCEAEIVHMLFEGYITGKSYSKLVSALSVQSIPYNAGSVWNKNMVHYYPLCPQ